MNLYYRLKNEKAAKMPNADENVFVNFTVLSK